MIRWLAVVGWLAAAGFVFSQFLSNPVPVFPRDYASTAFCLLAAGLIAIGGRVGRVGALVGTGAAAFATVAGLFFAISGPGSWLIAIGAAALMAISYAAARQLTETSAA